MPPGPGEDYDDDATDYGHDDHHAPPNLTAVVQVLVTYRGPSARAAVLPATGVSTPSAVPPAMADRLMVIPL